ncbi:MAG: preprotein translocase subunit SecG [Oscillospiraceae bacterium]|nr:preprotein translocase subunit SecG [Oscillospiraceae bacterium]
MSAFELISAICLIISCIFIITVVFFQGAQKGGMSQSITGQSSDNYYQRNMGRSKEMKLKRMTAAAAVIFFVVAIGVNLVAVHFGGEEVPVEDNTSAEADIIPDDFGIDEDEEVPDEDENISAEDENNESENNEEDIDDNNNDDVEPEENDGNADEPQEEA